MNRLVKFFWYISIIVFLITLLFVYAYLPGRVGVHADPAGIPDYYIDKATFFYTSIALFLLANIPLFILRRLLQKHWAESHVATQKSVGRLSLQKDLSNWLLSLATALNIFFIIGVVYLGIFNNAEGLDMWKFAPVVYAGPLLIGILFIVLLYIFFKKRPAR